LFAKSPDYSEFHELEQRARVDLKNWAVGLIKASIKLIPDEQIAENFKEDNAYTRWQKFNIRYKLILFAL